MIEWPGGGPAREQRSEAFKLELRNSGFNCREFKAALQQPVRPESMARVAPASGPRTRKIRKQFLHN